MKITYAIACALLAAITTNVNAIGIAEQEHLDFAEVPGKGRGVPSRKNCRFAPSRDVCDQDDSCDLVENGKDWEC